MRELGVTFELNKGKAFGQKPWSCDVLPHVFSGDEVGARYPGFAPADEGV